MAVGIRQALMLPQQSGQAANIYNTVQSLAALGQKFQPQVLLSTLLVLVVLLQCTGAMLMIFKSVLKGDASVSGGSVLVRSLSRLPAMVVWWVLFALILIVSAVIAAFALGILVVVLRALMPAALSQSVAGQQALIFGTVAVLYGGMIYLGFRLQFSLAALFLENAGPVSALKIGWKLTRGRWWRLFAIFSVGVIVIYVFDIIFSFLGIGAAALFATDMQARVIVTTVVGQIARIVMVPAYAALTMATYHDLKLRSEGGDLAARVAALGQA